MEPSGQVLPDASGGRFSPWQIVRLDAPSMDELIARAARAGARAGELIDRSDSHRFTPGDGCRLAIVARGVDDLAAKLSLVARCAGTSTASTLARKDIFLGRPASPPGEIAFLFPGQGSQYPGMLRELVDEFAPAAAALRRIDAVLGRLGIPAFDQFAGVGSRALGQDVWLTPLSMLCADTVIYYSLEALSIRPDVVAGHSFGEFPALLAAGAWDFENAVLATRARCRAVEACRGAAGQMLSIAAPGSVVEPFCRELGGRLYPAVYSSPNQTTVGGDGPSIERLQRRLTAERIASRVIPVPRPFHTPLMEPVRGPLAEGLRSIVLRRPVVPMLGGAANGPMVDPEEIRKNLVVQMIRPIRYVELVEQLTARGVRAMVEVGPRQILTRLHRKTLAGRDVLAIGADDRSRPGLSRLLAVEASLDVLGLLDKRRSRPTVDPFGPAGS